MSGAAARRRFDGLIFDMGDIFLDVTAWRRALAEDLRASGVDTGYPELVARWEKELDPVYRGNKPYWAAFSDLLRGFGVGAEEAALTERARERAANPAPRRLFDGVAATLEELHRRGVELCVLSDTESTEAKVRASLAKLGIEQHFRGVRTSFDLKAVKPEAAAFDAALAALGLPKQRCAFVAHDLDELEGCLAYGLTAVAFNHEPGVPADHHLTRFDELLGLVGGDGAAS